MQSREAHIWVLASVCIGAIEENVTKEADDNRN